MRCSSSEFQPLSTLVAGFAAIQALRFCGRLDLDRFLLATTIPDPVTLTQLTCTGKLGLPVTSLTSDTPCQLQFFDVLDVLPTRDHESVSMAPTSGRGAGIDAIVGVAITLRVQSATVSFV